MSIVVDVKIPRQLDHTSRHALSLVKEPNATDQVCPSPSMSAFWRGDAAMLRPVAVRGVVSQDHSESTEGHMPETVDPWAFDCRRCADGKTADSGLPVLAVRMFLCSTCGNKRCPKATDHILECSGSNDPGQAGSDY